MDLGLKNRVAFVAGASAGLGFATAKRLIEEGCSVALCSRNADNINAAAQRLSAVGNVLPLVCDVRDESQILAAYEQTAQHFGGLNILISNAGGPPAGFIDDFSSDDWRSSFELNLLSTINLSRHALPYLLEASRAEDGLARILMITSISAKQPIPNLYLSNTSRAGVQGFAKSLSEEVGAAGITVNTILPGYTRTERLVDLAEAVQARTGEPLETIEGEWAESTAVKRLGSVEEFAATAAFLVSKHAGFITGAAIPVDGGRAKGLL